MIRSFPTQTRKTPSGNSIDFAFGTQHLMKVVQDLENLKAQHEKEHTDRLEALANEALKHQQEHTEGMRSLQIAINEAKKIQKGDKGDSPVVGVDYSIPEISHEKIVSDVLSQIETPKVIHGKDAKVDYEKVARMASRLIKPKEVKIDHATIADSVLELLATGKKKISVNHLDGFKEGLEQTIGPIRSLAAGFRGGGDVVTAGSNVTISVDSNGKKVISSSGGSGFTTLTATETPNNSTTVFTFSTASAQPSYLVVDNVWMKATTKAGTVNWTWNNGAKQATLTIPPTDDIWGVV